MQTCCQDENANVMSDMVEKGLPFKEIFACINDNQISIRVQEPILEDDESECDSPCDCLDPLSETIPQINNSTEENLNKSRTVTVSQNEEDVLTKKELESLELEKLESKQPDDLEENPNIFVLKVRKNFGDEFEKYTLDIDFKVPRPWSKEMRDYFDRVYNDKPHTAAGHHHHNHHNHHKKTAKTKNGKVKNGNGKKKKKSK